MPTIHKQTLKPSRKATELQSAWDLEDFVKINIYGRSGTGKTTLWATFPGPILAVICSGGKYPEELKSINTQEYRKKITPLIIKEVGDVRRLLDDSEKYKTVVLDHVTSLQSMILREILGIEKIPEQLSWGLATQQQWGQCNLQTEELLRAFLDLRKHVVIVAQEREFSSSEESKIIMPYVASALTPGVVGWLNPACSYIVNTFIRPRMVEKRTKLPGGKEQVTKARGKGVEYCLRTGPDSIYTTKFRVPKGTALPDVVVDPTFDKINELLQQGG